MQSITPLKEAVDIIKEEGGEILKLCYQCGICTSTCPWNMVRSFLVRRIMHQGQLGLIDFEAEDMWLCVTCKACVDRCPRNVEIIDIMRALRRVVVEVGIAKVPDSLRLAVKNISGVGNPQGEEREKRTDWAKDLGVKTYAKGTEVLYFPCCVPAYDPQFQRVARATVNILKKVGVDFGILGAELSCCGESVRKAGNEGLFQSLAQNNISVFNKAGVKKIIVTSPHCYHTFMKEYPELGGNFEVIHFSQYLAELIKEGNLKLTKELNKKVTYHDSCYLGRHNDVYDEPREILKSIPGLELIEMTNHRENSLCCGGGGGRIWEETKKGERFSDMRIEQALEVGANILAVACPYCMVNFEDSVLTSDKGDVIEIKDIAELVQEVI
ncbi:MAG: (Fe-S)-binding protein [Dehalococcoidia bacterium]|nr:MAG: (Fe-S)-binding protein [Dehalococcoidia bacterium]